MRCRLRLFPLTKAVPLAISRGTTSAVEHLLVEVTHGGLTGRGETGGFDTGHRHFSTGAIAAELEAVAPRLQEASPLVPQSLEPLLAQLSPPARCGLDLALHDWRGQHVGQPLWGLWGLDPGACVATSVTLGLGTPAAALARLERWWRQLPATRIKLKLGSPEGLDHDRALLAAVSAALERRRQQLGVACELQVDANGGWSLEEALRMVPALQAHGVVLLEQPLAPQLDPERDTAGFAALHPQCPLPLVADESCWNLEDLLRLAPHTDGVNIKLLKSGGLTEALLMARTARRLGLGVMLGCYSDGALLNGAAAQLLPLVRWPDLDSHLNLVDDPFTGLECQGDQLRLPPGPGLGIGVPAAWSALEAPRATLQPRDPVVLLLHGGLDNLSGKTGLALLRYRTGPLLAVVDPDHAGRSLAEVTGIDRSVPVLESVAAALPLGPAVAVVGLAPSGGQLPPALRADLATALRAGWSVASGLHSRIGDDPELAALRAPGAWIWDLRQEPPGLTVAAARAAALPCRRLLAVGTDMAVGKMSACLELLAAARRRGLAARFVGTGQAGILIAGRGVPLDAVRVDYAAGAVEAAVLEAGSDLGPEGLLLVEGQGSLCHPGSSATLPLLRGSQPTALLLVHRAGQHHIKGHPHLPIPPLAELIVVVEGLAALGRADGLRPRVEAVALNTALLSDEEAAAAVSSTAEQLGLVCVDPVRQGAGALLGPLVGSAAAGPTRGPAAGE